MRRTSKLLIAATLIAGSASVALAEDSSSSFDKRLGNGNAGYSDSMMTSRSVSLNTQTSRKSMNRASQVRDGGAR